MYKKILTGLLILISFLFILSFLPFNKWAKLDNLKTNQLKNVEWLFTQYEINNKILSVWSAPVSNPHSHLLNFSGTITILNDNTNTKPKNVDLPLTIDLYDGPEFDLPENEINFTYKQAKNGAAFNKVLKTAATTTNLFLRVFHFFPNHKFSANFKLHSKPNSLQNIALLCVKIKTIIFNNFIINISILVFLILSLTINPFISKKIYLCFIIILIVLGLISFFIPIGHFTGPNVIKKEWNKKTNNTNILKLNKTKIESIRITIESNKYYLISWQDRLINKSNSKAICWKLDLFSSKCDWGVHETKLYFSRMKSFFSRNYFTINSLNFTSGYIRFMEKNRNEIEIKDLTIKKIPDWVFKFQKLGYYFLTIGTLLFILFFRIQIKNIIRFSLYKYKIMIPLLVLSYLIPVTVFLTKIYQNNNNNLSLGVVYRFLFAPPFIAILLFIAGWPIIRYCLNGKHKQTAEFLLAFPIGFLLILSTYSLSYIGITPLWCIIILGIILFIAWIFLMYKKQFPSLPKPVSLLPFLIAILLFWIGISPLTTQKDVHPFTKSYNDMCAYIPMIQWNMEHSMKEISKLALKNEEPPYIAYLAYKERKLSSKKSAFGNYIVFATLAKLTGLTAYHIYALMSGIFLSLIFLSIIGSLLAVKLIRNNIFIVISALCLSCNFIILIVVWEGFYSSLVGFIALFPITTLGTYAFVKRNYKFTLICGLGLAAILNAYHPFIYIICAQLAFAAFLVILKNIFTAKWNNIIKIIGVGFSIFIFTMLFAPQQTSLFVKRNILHPNIIKTMSNNDSGGLNVPIRSFYLINGFLGDWTNSCLKGTGISPEIYKIISFILTILFFIIILRMILFRRKTFSALFIFSSIIPYSLLIAWAYFKVPNKYIYFKSLGYISPFVSIAFLIAWLDWYKISKYKLLKLCLLIIIFFWISWRVIALYGGINNSFPTRFLDESISSLEDIYKYVPTNDCIRINFSDIYYSPHVITVLRNRQLHITKPFGYICQKYRNYDWKFSLENKSLENTTNIWNNGTYYLYNRNDLIK